MYDIGEELELHNLTPLADNLFVTFYHPLARDKQCGHICELMSPLACCRCMDKRDKAGAVRACMPFHATHCWCAGMYVKYVDGIGDVMADWAIDGYCGTCQDEMRLH